MPKEEFNAVFFDMTWRDRIVKEQTEMLGARGRPDVTLYHGTETDAIFGGSDLRQDYLTEYTGNMGDRPKNTAREQLSELPQDTFIPESSFHTTMGDTYGYGDKYRSADANIFNGTRKSRRL